MSHIGKNYGIVTEQYNNSVALFDINNLQLLDRVALPDNITTPLDVVITPDGSKAVVLSTYSDYILQLDLNSEPPIFTKWQHASTHLTELDISPDGRFAAAVDGSLEGTNIFSYELLSNSYVSQLPAYVQAVAISPNGNGLVLTARYNESETPSSALLPFLMDTTTGTLTGPNAAIDSQGSNPENITFTPDGYYAFVANTARNGGNRNIAIFKIQSPNSISPLGNVSVSNWPQSIAVSRDGKKVYVLTLSTVDIFDFDPSTSPYLTPSAPVPSFSHHLPIGTYYGVDQIALDRTGTRLLISSYLTAVKIFDAQTGQDLGTVQDVTPDGGIAAAPAIIRGLKFS